MTYISAAASPTCASDSLQVMSAQASRREKTAVSSADSSRSTDAADPGADARRHRPVPRTDACRSGHRALERRDCNGPRLCDRLAQRLDAFDLVHRLGREIGLAAAWARPHRDVLDHQQPGRLAKAPRDVLELHPPAAAMVTVLLARRRFRDRGSRGCHRQAHPQHGWTRRS